MALGKKHNLPSIRASLLAVLAILVLTGGALSVVLGYSTTSDAVIGEVQRRVELDLRSAWAHYDAELARIESIVKLVSIIQKTKGVLDGSRKDIENVRMRLEEIRKEYRLDVLTLVDTRGRVFMRTRYPYANHDSAYQDSVISNAIKTGHATGTVLIPGKVLKQEGEHLAEQAFMEIASTPMAAATTRTVETSGMMMKAVQAVVNDSNNVIGYVYGGVLLNRNYPIVDSIRDTIFQNDTWKGKPLGNVTIFQGDMRVATNVLNKDGTRAIGTRVSKVVRDRVLESGQPYYDRAFVVNDWYLTAYDPISDNDGQVIGMIYVGVLEAKYLAYRNRLIQSFIGSTVVGTVLVLLLSLIGAILLSQPLQRLTLVARQLSEGNLDARVLQTRLSFQDVATLTSTFNEMADNIVIRRNELAEANQAMATTNEELVQVNRAYMDMLEFVTHELKSPLSSVLFGITSLKEGYFGPVNNQQTATLDSVEKNVEYLNEMILKYLNLSRIEKDEMHFSPQPVAFLSEVFQPIIDQVSRQTLAADMTIECRVPKEARGHGDVDLLKIVFDNLLSNAIKYGWQGTSIVIGYEALTNGHRFFVKNEGRGIARDDLDKLFKKFSRLNVAELKARKGTGLGLFITREIVERHGGRIWADSEENRWASFFVELPDTSSTVLA